MGQARGLRHWSGGQGKAQSQALLGFVCPGLCEGAEQRCGDLCHPTMGQAVPRVSGNLAHPKSGAIPTALAGRGGAGRPKGWGQH